MNFTYRNHLQYSIGGREYGYRETPIEKFEVRLGTIDTDQYRTSSFEKELYRTAQLIQEDFGKDLIVFLSGGTDSEIVLRNFIHNGFKPRCVMIKFKNNYNVDEVIEAQTIANELDVKLELIDFDVKDFFLSGAATDFGEQIQSTQITYIMMMYQIQKLGAPAVMGGEAGLTRNVTKDGSFWYYAFRENEDASAMRFSLKYNIPLIYEYFSYTPELLLYYLESEGVKNLISDKYNYKLTASSSKNAILETLYPRFRKKKKKHGFESLLAFNQQTYEEIGLNQVKRLEYSLDGVPYAQAIKQLKGEI
jgi:tRNA(Ile)-lysidine synthase TilS/MesJ